MPEEVKIAAQFMNLTEADFISRFCKEHVEDGVRAFSPACKPGKTECIFINTKGLCDIHAVKPYECKKVFGCESSSRHRRIREMIKRRWK
jgi:Fe-S-cluster containining protein